MPPSTSSPERQLLWQFILAAIGAAAFCIYSRSWKDGMHLIYDIPASLMVFWFIGHLVLDSRHFANADWLARLTLLLALTVVTVGREFLHWPISGHLTCVLAVALVQSTDPRLFLAERWLVWLPVPIVIGIRWWLFDQGQHEPSYHAMFLAVASAVPVVIVTQWTQG